MRFTGLATLAVVALCACGGGDGGGPQASSIALSAGDNQVAAAGAALPESLAVIVRDNAGAALPGVLVTWSVTAGGGSVSPTTRTSDAGGIAKTRRTLGPNAGTQTARATVASLTPVNFSAISQIQGAVNIANATTGPLTDTVLATKAESLDVLVTDQNAAAVQGVAVAWAASAGTGSVSASNVATSATGHSKVTYTYGDGAGAQAATATVTGLVGSPVTITFQATARTGKDIVKTAGDNGTAAPSAQVTYTVTARDLSANPKPGVAVDWADATGGGSITPAQRTTGANGQTSATRTLGAGTGDQTATATATALTGTPQVTFTTHAQIITTITIADNSFTPSDITVPLHTSVTWSWTGINTHNVTFTAAAGVPTDISDRTSGSVARSFDTAGTFQFRCTHHAGMTGSVTVNP